eukprot:15469522-Alexandrium_andersonii.AAC.1
MLRPAVPGSAQLKLRTPEAMLRLSAVQAPSTCYLESAPADACCSVCSVRFGRFGVRCAPSTR